MILTQGEKIRIATHNGRSALHIGLKIYDFDRNSSVLVPDFICESILKPFKKLGVKIIYYRIKDDLSPNWDQIELISNKQPISAILMVHYFGQPQEIKKFKYFCEQKNILLIDDNAHGHSGKDDNTLLGTSGNFGFSSPRKLLGISSGAFIYIEKNKYAEAIKLEKKFKKRNTFFFINNMKNSYMYNGILKSIRNRFIDWTNPFEFRDKSEYEFKNDEKSLNYIDQINWSEYSKKRRENCEKVKFYLIKSNLKPVFDRYSSSSCPWSLPMYAENISHRNEWIKWGISNNVPLFTWPSLPTDIIEENSIAFMRWKRLVCFPLDNYFMKRYEKL